VPGASKQQSARLGSNVDFAPTLAALLDLPRPSSWQGQNLLADDFAARPVMMFGRASFTTEGLLDGQLKYIHYSGDDQRALYDLSSDPHEQTNLAQKYPERIKAYDQLVHRWLPVAEYRALEVSR
jgi:arylsulfatase A-like enzyme